MTRSQGHQGGLLGQEKEADEETLRKCKAFLCDIYPTSKKRPQTADELRHITFCQKKQKNETLPSTSNSVQQHNHRVNNQIHIWRCSLDSLQQIPSPVGHGWVIKDGELKPQFMTKDPTSSSLPELTHCVSVQLFLRQCRSFRHRDLRLYDRGNMLQSTRDIMGGRWCQWFWLWRLNNETFKSLSDRFALFLN